MENSNQMNLDNQDKKIKNFKKKYFVSYLEKKKIHR